MDIFTYNEIKRYNRKAIIINNMEDEEMSRRKIWLSLVASVLFFAFLLSSIPHQSVAVASTTTNLVNKQIQLLKTKKLSGGFEPVSVVSASITGKSIPEVVATYDKFNRTRFMYESIVNVHSYDTKRKTWKIVASFKYTQLDSPYMYITKGKLLDNTKEQVVLGTVGGSGGYLSPIVLGSKDGKTINILLDPEESFYSGDAVIKNKELFFLKGTIVSQKYVFKNGKFYRYKGTGADDRKVAAGAKYLLTLEKKNGKTVYTGSRHITMKVGEKLSIVRKNLKDNNDYGYRILFGDNGVLEYGYVFTAKKPGKEIWSFEPEAYGESIEITITVTK
jgi:hypothetical protein